MRRALDDPGAVRRVDTAEVIGRIGRDGVAAVRAVAHVDANGHTARLAADSVAVIATIRYRTWPEAHGSHLASLGSHLAEIGSIHIIRWIPVNRPNEFEHLDRIVAIVRWTTA